jgi:hypothetical protein
MRTDQTSSAAIRDLALLGVQASAAEHRLSCLSDRLRWAAATPAVAPQGHAVRFGAIAVLSVALVFLLAA